VKYYLAYGSNLNKNQMAFRCPDAVPVGVSRIPNYQLAFRRGFLTIEPKKGSSVPVGVWAISDEDEKHLDRYEGCPRFYRKESMLLNIRKSQGDDTEDNYQDALVYIMNDGFRIEEPSLAYMRTCSQGYKDFGLNAAPLMRAYRKVKGGDA